MEESSRDSYQKLGDTGEEENNNTDKKCNKKLIIIIAVVLGLVVAGVVVTIVLLSSSSPSPSPSPGITCPDGQYLPSDDQTMCYNCTSNCKQCTGTKNESQCTACYDGYSLDGDICEGLFSIKGEYTTQTDLETVTFFNIHDFIDNVENMTIDGNELDQPVPSYEFSKAGNHKVYFNLKSDIDVSDLSSLFSGSKLNAVVFSEDFDSTNVTKIDSMFSDSELLTSVDLGHFITTNVVDMTNLFAYCVKLNYVDISKFSANDNVTLFEGELPVNGSIKLTKDFHEKIKGQFPDSWIVNETDNDIYDLLEN